MGSGILAQLGGYAHCCPHLSSGFCTCLLLGGYAGQHMLQLRFSKYIDVWTFVSIRAR